MLQKEIEPGLLKTFRYFVGLAAGYFLIFFIYTARTTGTWISPNLALYYINFSTNLFLLVYLFWGWLKNKLKHYYLPIALVVAGFVPIASSFILWPFEPEPNLTAVIFRSWSLIPVLIVPVVLISWQYGYNVMVAFVTVTFLYDLPLIFLNIGEISLETMPVLGVPFIRSLAFGTVGHIVHLLMETQRKQRKKLIAANVQLAQYADTLEQLTISRERNRLARELHDTLAHTLSGQIVTLEALKLELPDNDIQARIIVNQLLENTRTGLSDTRRALRDLRSKQLEDLGITIALTNLVHDAAARANTKCTIHIQESLPPLANQLEQCIYRISQEALQNIIKHAEASIIELNLSANDGVIRLLITDNGIGFSSQNSQAGYSLGIKGMEERAQELGGKFTLSSIPEHGTAIEVTFEVTYD